MKYAAQTTVSSEKSQSEIRSTLNRYGATKFAYMEEEGRAAVAFEFVNRRVRFTLHLPSRTERRFTHNGHRQLRTIEKQREAYEQGIRQAWRALTLSIKAKLEAVESGIATFEEEFLSHIIMPNGQTIGEWMAPQIERAYLSSQMPPLMLTDGSVS